MATLLRQPRVCSVLPSATEMLCFIGGEHLLVGRSHEDNFPASVTSLPILTGQKTTFTTAADVDAQVSASLSAGESLYTIDVELLQALKPDIILTQDICSVCAIDLESVESAVSLMFPKPRIVSLNPMCLEDVLANILELGEAVGLEASARQAHDGLLARIAAVDDAVAAAGRRQQQHTRPSLAFVEWPDPIYVGGHWTPQLIERAGGAHPLNPAPTPGGIGGGGGGKSFAVAASALVATQPDVVVVCPCGLQLDGARSEAQALAKQPWWGSLPAVASGRVFVVDGDAMFNRPGPRLVDCLEWLASVLLLPLPPSPAAASLASSPAAGATTGVGAATPRNSSADGDAESDTVSALSPALYFQAPKNFPFEKMVPSSGSIAPTACGGVGDIEDVASPPPSTTQKAAATAAHSLVVGGTAGGACKNGDDAAAVEAAHKSAQASLAVVTEAHRAACAAGQLQYKDPVTGYLVFTQLAGVQRGHCCGSGCRHCNFNHVNVKPEERRRSLAPPITVVLES